jgi:hypothetical protein
VFIPTNLDRSKKQPLLVFPHGGYTAISAVGTRTSSVRCFGRATRW